MNLATSMRNEEVETGAVETIEEVERIEEAVITAEIIPIIVTGIVLNVTTLTLHSEPNVIDVESPKVPVPNSSVTIEAAETTVVEEMTAVEETTAVVEMTAEIIAVTIQTTIGIVLNVTTLISHSELNVTAVENLRVKAVQTNAMIDAVETTEEAEMTAEDEKTDAVEAKEEVEMTAEDETTGAVETTVETILITIGNAENVRTPTSHSEQNVTVVAHLKAVEREHLQETGKETTEDQAIDAVNKLQDLETGIVHNVGSPILLRETTVSVVDVPRE